MDQQNLSARDLEAYIGSSGRVSEVLNRKRPLSLRMIKRLHDGLSIPYESLLAGAG
jgi:HTH-type transcriptional regulator/antitoxin HigA